MITFLIVVFLLVIFFDRVLLGLAVIGTLALLILDGLQKVISDKRIWYILIGLLILYIIMEVLNAS